MTRPAVTLKIRICLQGQGIELGSGKTVLSTPPDQFPCCFQNDVK